MRIKELAKDIHRNAVNKGFWDINDNVGEKLMLVVSELGEAMEAHRADKFTAISVSNVTCREDDKEFNEYFKRDIKDTFEDELADSIIRLLDLSERLNIDIEAHIEAKMRHNLSRPKLHGKKY